jgi:ATP-dependent Clp protease ATP-binding subunit ClpA
MARREESADDIFEADGRLRQDLFTESALTALLESVGQARHTQWDSLRSPHIFMGLLAAPDPGVLNWGKRLGANPDSILTQFQELFRQDVVENNGVLSLSREFLSDKAIHLLREARRRAASYNRGRITPMDLLISLLTAQDSVVAGSFESIGITAARLTELAVIAEHEARCS